MKKLLFLFTCLLGASLTQAQSESDKTLIKTLDPKNADFVVFQLPAATTLKEPKKWDNNTLRVELEIHANMSEETLTQLIKANRYAFDGTTKDDTYIITAPNMEKKVSIKGVDLVEKIYVNITAPGNYTLDANEKRFSRDITDFITSTSGTAGRGGLTSANLLKMRQFSEPIQVHIKLVPTGEFAKANKATAGDEPKEEKKSANKTSPSNKSNNRAATSAPAKVSANTPDKTLKYGDILIDDVPIPFEW
jgi:hypothetical protein